MMQSSFRPALRTILCLAACSPVCGALSAQVPTPSKPEAAGKAELQARPAETDEQRVVQIRVVNESGQVEQENPAGLPVAPGQDFSSQTVRESLRQLYRTGRYADVRAETSPVAGGVRLDFLVQRNYFTNRVRVLGLREPPGEAVALAALRLNLGEAFREKELKEALERLQQTLREEGLYRAQLSYDLAPNSDTRQMDITVRVAPGPRARLGLLTLRNETALPDPVLLRQSKLKPQTEITMGRLDRASERMRKLLVKREYLGARVSLRRSDYDAQANRVPLEIQATAGPKVRVGITGTRIRRRDRRKLVPIYEEGAVDEDLLQEGRRAIRDFLERQGYFDAEVSYTTSIVPAAGRAAGPPESVQVVTYSVQRGPRHRLLDIEFEGNKYFSDELLRSRLRAIPSEFGVPGRFSRRLLQEDGTSIRDLYVANGFRDAEVRSELIDNYNGKEGDVFVRFHITEDVQTRVASLKIEGIKAFREEELMAVIGSTAGQAYSEFNVSGDRDNILALYFNEGLPQASFTAVTEEVPDAPLASGGGAARGKSVRLTYRIVEGPQENVARLLISGYEHTRLSTIRREVQVKPGGPLREGEVVDTQRRLYNLGIFSRVAIAPQNPAGSDSAKTVVALVEEGKRYTVAYGGGFEVQRLGGPTPSTVGGAFRASPRGILEISKNNLTGRADTLSLKLRASTIQGRALLSYTAPNTFGRPAFSTQLTALADKASDIQTFTATRYEGTLQLAQRVTPFTSMLYRYSVRKVIVDAKSLRISPDQIPLFSQPTQVSLFGGTWVRERRDNPADATRGDFNNVDFSFAGESIGSSASFVRFFAQNSTFHPLKRRYVLARSARFGLQTPVGGSLSSQIPLPERFFAGGGSSLRGFGLNQAGPRDPTTGFPVGGLALLIFNQELRFPMRLPFVGTRLGGTLFYDAGNVFANVRRITLRTTPVSPSDLNYFSHTVGFGFRYATPIGPVRVDLAYQLNAAQFCIPSPPLSPGPGASGCAAGGRLARLPRFQFFFNLGSTF